MHVFTAALSVWSHSIRSKKSSRKHRLMLRLKTEKVPRMPSALHLVSHVFFWRLWPSRPGTPRPLTALRRSSLAGDYPTTPGKDVWNCDGHENEMTKFARPCVEERVSRWHAHGCVSRYVCMHACICVCLCVLVWVPCQWTGQLWALWVRRRELWSRLLAGALSGKHDRLNTPPLYALID